MLVYEEEHIDAMLGALEKSMQSMKGEISMSTEEKFKGFDFSQDPYEEEARRLWGNETIEKSNAVFLGTKCTNLNTGEIIDYSLLCKA